MRIRLILTAFLALAVMAGTSSAHDKAKKNTKKADKHWTLHKGHRGPHTIACRNVFKKRHKKDDPYDLSASALNGPSGTEIYLTIETDDSEEYPIPQDFDKVQVKVLNDRGRTVWVKNFKDVTITDGEAVLSIDGLAAGKTIEVVAKVKVRGRKKVKDELCATTVVSFRPDLIVFEVHAPDQAGPNVPLTIEAVVREVKTQTDATANVSLWDGATLLTTATGVFVPAGDQVSVFFTGIMLAEGGTHDLSIRITDAEPGEYDVTNNDLAFQILISNPVEPAQFTLTYFITRNYAYLFTQEACGDVLTVRQEGSFASWNIQLDFDLVPTSPVDSVSWEAVCETGQLTRNSITGLAASTIGGSSDSYDIVVSDPDGSSMYLSMFVNKVTSQTHLSLSKTANNWIYVVTMNSDTTDFFDGEQSLQADFSSFLEARVLFADDGWMVGGSATVAVAPFVPTSFLNSDSFFDGSCTVSYSESVSYEESSNSVSGTTDPAILPSGSAKDNQPAMAESLLPKTTDLVQNYPNPFNPTTNIEFTVSRSGPATLRVYDMLGKEVAELFRGDAEEGRTYQVAFQASNLSSGMYYARLEAGGRQYMQKMLLMK